MRRGVTMLAALVVLLPTIGAAALDLTLTDRQGRPQRLADHQGRIVVVNFWATWCAPCRAEMPMLARVAREWRDRGVEVVGVSTDAPETQPAIDALVAEAQVTFPIWVGGTTRDMERFGLGAALPATAIVDRDGTVAFRLLGALDEAVLRARLAWLAGARREAAPEAVVEEARGLEADHDHHAHDEHDTHDEHDGHDEHAAHGEHAHAEGEEGDHAHGAVALEGASLVPS